MATVVETIPFLLHVSLFLFFAGLIAFLHPVNTLLQYTVLTLFILCFSLYFLVTILPILRLSCPFWTPLSTVLWSILQQLQLLYRRDSDGNRVPVDCSMSKAQQLDAIGITPDRDQRDFKAMSWTIGGLREDNELEPFINIIPNVVSGIDYSAKLLLDNLMNHPDIDIRLRVRVPRLLASCIGGIDPSVARKRATTCLKAIWSLTMLSIPKPGSPHPDSFRQSPRFKEDTFALLYNIRKAIPSTEDFVCSTTVVLARSLTDMQIDRASALERSLLDHIQTKDEIVENQVLDYCHPFPDHSHLEALKLRLQMLDSRMHEAKSVTSSLPYVMFEAVATMQCRIGALAMDSSYPTDRRFILELVHCVREFQRMLNQVGFSLVVEYAIKVIHSNSPLHEAFNTFRRVFFRVNFGLSPFTPRSQERLVACLDEALEISSGSTRLAQNIIDLLLSLTSGLTDPMCVLKAKGIIQSYARFSPQDTAFKALTMLEEKMPSETQSSMVSDLLCSHISSDARPMKNRKPTSLGPS